MEKSKIYSIIIIAYAALVSGFYLSKMAENPSFGLALNLVTYLTPLFPIYFGYKSIKYFGLQSLQGKSILFITITVVLFLIADIMWSILGFPVVSVSDILWLGGYVIFYIGIFFAVKTVNPTFLNEKKRVFITTLVLAAIVILYFKYFPLSWDTEISAIENIVTSGYVLADLLLAMFIIILLSMIFSGSYSTAWMILSVGAIVRWISDILYAINYDTYGSGDIIDLGWFFSYIFYALAFIILKSNAENTMFTLAKFKKGSGKKD